MDNLFQKEQQTALEAVREAARLCKAVQAHLDQGVLNKSDRSPVTIADFGSQALICRVLQEVFPADPVIAEEDTAALGQPEQVHLLSKVVEEVQTVRPKATAREICDWIDHGRTDTYQDRFWTLDPIDGTKGFLRNEQFAIALALIVDGVVQVGVLGCPNLGADPTHTAARGTLYAAVRGQGAWEFPLDGTGEARPLRVSGRRDPASVQYCESVEAAHNAQGDTAAVAKRLGISSVPVRLDSQAKYAIVARGSADLYLRLPTRVGYVEKIWDHAAGALMVEEAGGTVTDMNGKPLDFRHGRQLLENQGIVATNGQLHDAVLNAIHDAALA